MMRKKRNQGRLITLDDAASLSQAAKLKSMTKRWWKAQVAKGSFPAQATALCTYVSELDVLDFINQAGLDRPAESGIAA